MSAKQPSSVRGFSPSKKSISAARRDAEWLDKIANQQDANALSDLFEIYGSKLKGWLMARGVGSGTAEDIVQDVMIKVWTRAVLFDPKKQALRPGFTALRATNGLIINVSMAVWMLGTQNS